METVVFQSFRRVGVPRWIDRCIASVRDWAAARGYAYRFFGDEIFDLLPDFYRLRTADYIQLRTDLARLLAAAQLLAEGHPRVIWLDADVHIFGPLAIPDARELYFCREVWDDEVRVNNCACVFTQREPFLPFYIAAAQQLMRAAAGKLDPLMVGTRFLTELDRVVPLPKLETIALVAPPVLRDIAAGGGPHLAAYRARFGPVVHAANLCLSFRGNVLEDADYERAIDALPAAFA